MTLVTTATTVIIVTTVTTVTALPTVRTVTGVTTATTVITAREKNGYYFYMYTCWSNSEKSLLPR